MMDSTILTILFLVSVAGIFGFGIGTFVSFVNEEDVSVIAAYLGFFLVSVLGFTSLSLYEDKQNLKRYGHESGPVYTYTPATVDLKRTYPLTDGTTATETCTFTVAKGFGSCEWKKPLTTPPVTSSPH